MNWKVTGISQQDGNQRYIKVDMFERNETNTEDTLIFTHHMPVTSNESASQEIQTACDEIYQEILRNRAKVALAEVDPLIGLEG